MAQYHAQKAQACKRQNWQGQAAAQAALSQEQRWFGPRVMHTFHV